MQLSLFTADRLPKKPYCSDDLNYGLKIRTLARAIKHRYIQPNDPIRRHWLVYDIDREGASEAWDGIAAEPNISIITPSNGHGHLLYCLEVPVYLQGKARLGPIKKAAAVDAAYVDLLAADRGYAGLICKNPLHDHWRVLKGNPWAYDLDGLAEWIPGGQLTRYKRQKRTMQQGLGRNVTLFDGSRAWAYRNINRTGWVSFDVWHRAVLDQAGTINAQFPMPLPWPEVKATAKSIAKWVWEVLRGRQADYVARTHTPEIQAARGRKGGVASGESRRKGTPLEHDPEPWLALGISRAQWYRLEHDQTHVVLGANRAKIKQCLAK